MSDIKPGKKFFTVVYEIQSPEAFQSTAAFASEQLLNETVSHGAKVTSCGWGDYATERDAFAWQLEKEGYTPDKVVEEFIEAEELEFSARDITG